MTAVTLPAAPPCAPWCQNPEHIEGSEWEHHPAGDAHTWCTRVIGRAADGDEQMEVRINRSAYYDPDNGVTVNEPDIHLDIVDLRASDAPALIGLLNAAVAILSQH